jgi:hypothetical protein
MNATPDPATPQFLIIDQSGRIELSAADKADLARALALVAGGGGRLARAAGMLAKVAGMAAAPLAHTLGRAIGLRRTIGGSTLAPVIAQVMSRAFDVATLAMPNASPPGRLSPAARARLAAIASGVAGGAAGLPGFVPDAAFTTLLILRNIAAIAVAQGEDLATESARHACIEVFTLGAPVAPTASGAAAAAAGEHEGYWTVRMVVQGTPLVALIGQAAGRLGLVLSEKFALQIVPLAGAAGGALVNAAFMDHYRALAEGHFTIRRLERAYGVEAVRWAATSR